MSAIGWIGTGVMGKSMCRHLMDGGHSVAVFNRTKSKAEELLAAGARWAESPAEAARRNGCSAKCSKLSPWVGPLFVHHRRHIMADGDASDLFNKE